MRPRGFPLAIVPVLALAFSGCSCDISVQTDGGKDDRGGFGDGGSGTDSGPLDAGTVGDAGGDGGGVDSGSSDAGGSDAGRPRPDAGGVDGGVCGEIGRPCAAGCPTGMSCYSGSAGNFCAPARPTCGGFAGAQCAQDAPVCLTLVGTDYGACVTAAEKDCVCVRARQAVTGC